MNSETKSQGRRLIHTRRVECQGFLREDGLWDIEGRLSDSKTHDVTLPSGRHLPSGELYHGMLVRLTLDDELLIRAVTVEMSRVPTDECPAAAAYYEKLVGMRISSGFSRRIKEVFGGTGGCVHLSELLLPIATTAFQTIPMGRSVVARRGPEDLQAYSRLTSSRLNTCHALREDGPLAVYLKE